MNLISYYLLKAPARLVYMLQQVEYDSFKFLSWAIKVPDLRKVQKRQTLQKTARAKATLAIAYTVWLLSLAGGLIGFFITSRLYLIVISILAPVLTTLVLFVATWFLQRLVVDPAAKREITQAKAALQKSSAIRIAVLGSYGKTTMKELLNTVLSTAKKVAATPGNKNVLISHARWVNHKLSGDEEVLIFEYGEAGPGDIARLANFSLPNLAVITGLAPAHMDSYPNVEAVADDLASIQKVVAPEDCFVNHTSPLLTSKISGNHYSSDGLNGIRVIRSEINISGVTFVIERNDQQLQLKSHLLGRHQIGPLLAVAAIAYKLGLTDEQVQEGIAQTKPFEHRMQPYQLGGAWIIDDSYNGNIEGVRAGLELLKQLPAKRKIYVTPGLVDQGSETERVHLEMGRLIGGAKPDQVVLMQNSATLVIERGLKEANYSGEIKVVSDPLAFYTNLEHFVAGGDLIMLQNDWTDNYQ